MTLGAVIFDLGDTLLRSVSFDPVAGNERLLELAHPGHKLSAADIQRLANAMSGEIESRTDQPARIADYGFRKPSPIFFGVALARLGIAPADAWMVGDKVEFDVIGARRSGIRPFWYHPEGLADPRAGDCVVLRHWNQFADEIRSL